MLELTWNEVIQRRLQRNSLAGDREEPTLPEVAGTVCGIQAQVPAAADLALGIRAGGTTAADVAAALWEQRTLVKTWAMRGTLHLLPAEDLPLYLAALSTHWTRLLPRMLTYLGLSAEELWAGVEAVRQALDGRCLTRAELTEEVIRLSGMPGLRAALLSGWGYITGPAAARGYLCFGPSEGRNVTFVRPDQWLKHWSDVDGSEARRTLARRYLETYGPATHGDFARWTGMPTGDARSLFEELAGELEAVKVEGRRAWLLASDAGVEGLQPAGSIRLVPQYDCYVIGSYPMEAILPEEARARIRQHGRGRYEGAVGLPLVLQDGAVAGMWERNKRGKRLAIRVELFADLGSEGRRRLEAEAARIGHILGAEAEIAIGPLGA